MKEESEENAERDNDKSEDGRKELQAGARRTRHAPCEPTRHRAAGALDLDETAAAHARPVRAPPFAHCGNGLGRPVRCGAVTGWGLGGGEG